MATRQAIDSLSEAGVEPWKTWAVDAAPELELYDLLQDPWQLNNLARLSEHAELVDSLDVLLRGVFAPNLDWGWIPESDMIVQFGLKDAP